ncbi:MAG: hypothetical protein ACE5JA_00905 [bacterium]
MEARSMPTGVAVLKWYFIIVGIISIIMALIVPSIFAAVMRAAVEATGEFGAGAAVGGVGFFWAFFLICWGIFEIFIGLHLGKGRGWARIAAIVVGIVSLPSIPIGTVLGILCLVILFGQEGKAYFAA